MVTITPAEFYYKLTHEEYFIKNSDRINELLCGKSNKELLLYLWLVFPRYRKKPARSWIKRKIEGTVIVNYLKYASFYLEHTKDIDTELEEWNRLALDTGLLRRKVEGILLKDKELPVIYKHDYRFLSFIMLVYKHKPISYRYLLGEGVRFMQSKRIKEKLIEPQLLLKIPKREIHDQKSSEKLQKIFTEIILEV